MTSLQLQPRERLGDWAIFAAVGTSILLPGHSVLELALVAVGMLVVVGWTCWELARRKSRFSGRIAVAVAIGLLIGFRYFVLADGHWAALVAGLTAVPLIVLLPPILPSRPKGSESGCR